MLLERSLAYALGAVGDVTPDALARPTPCDAWDLRALLEHVAESMDALLEGLVDGCVGPPVAGSGPAGDPVPAVRRRATHLLAACAAAGVVRADGSDGASGARVARGTDEAAVLVGDRVLAARMLAWVGAVELAVHGWDVAQACGADRPIPAGLARNLLAIVPLVVTDATREGRFAPPAVTPPGASPDERLLAFLGRSGQAPRADR
jgi:uncharacterized protein (TIGR03086 family)